MKMELPENFEENMKELLGKGKRAGNPGEYR